ncbi:MAG TPA: ABC transporter ATP-binding protein [Candidatus Limnocylindria bacterium]|nr:ABC transporter ATP-binding protein [Candidatus Limnocylindria bacterium]
MEAAAPRVRPAPPRLAVEDLRIVVAGTAVDVVDEVSFTVHAGEVLGLVGESGSGKTTVALALLGHHRRGLEVGGGRVILEGEDLLAMSGAELQSVRGAKVSYVPQDPGSALNPALPVGLQLGEILGAHKDPGGTRAANRVMEVLAEAQLDATPEFLRRYPHQLSGGQQQRVAIAMAFACRPSLIVLDEPTTGLDVTTQRHVLETITTLCRTYGVAAVYVSHDLAVVGQLAQQVAVMYAGRIVELGPTETIFGAPAHPYTRALLRAVPSPERSEVLEGIEGQAPRPGRRPPGCFFAPRCPDVLPICRESPPPVVPLLAGAQLVRCVRADEPVTRGAGGRAVPPGNPSAGTSGGALEVRELSARYGPQLVLFEIDLRVGPEQCVAIVGESGSGKTTLARCVVGLHDNWTGEVRFCGEPLACGAKRRTKGSLQRIQYVFQNPYTSLNPRKTVGQIVEQPLDHFSRLPPDERERRVLAVLDDVCLSPDFLARYPDQLSGGERQRVALARALVVEPELLVCDEVTSALDVSVQAIIVELLRGLQRERNLAMLFITHNLALVRSIAQTVVVLSAGKVVEQGPVEEILERPRESYTIRLLEDVPKLAETRTTASQSR